ncbi:hypothetical protein TM239_42360 [Bradyrhizobium sp. TM239]|nr:hypothetical protein TM233_48630 [Bradyrhizobium sp. TM233]GMP05581.1 hypothetical protein TM239_42360 [Bradyrhizobium sp. TM239]
MALLAAISLDFRHRETVNADGGQGVTDFFQLEWLDNRHNNFHGSYPRLGPVRTWPGVLDWFATREKVHYAGTARTLRIKCRARSGALPNGL